MQWLYQAFKSIFKVTVAFIIHLWVYQSKRITCVWKWPANGMAYRVSLAGSLDFQTCPEPSCYSSLVAGNIPGKITAERPEG